MTGTRGVVQRILDVLRRPSQTSHAELRLLSEQLGAACREVNDRLDRCARFLAKGLRTEALHEAKTPPPLLEECNVLLSKEIQDWRELCQVNRVMPPDGLQADLVEMLRNAVEDSVLDTKNVLALQTEYRKAVLGGTRRQRVALLRKLHAAEPLNPNWASDLAAEERVLLEDLSAEGSALERRKSEEGLARLLAELRQDGWREPPDPRLVERVEAARKAVRKERIAAECRRVGDSIGEAFNALDVGRLDRELARFDELATDEGFAADESLLVQVGEARAFLEQTRQRQQEAAEFEASAARLESLLSGPAGALDIENAIRRAEAFSRDLPAGLVDRARERIATLQLQDARRFRLRMAALAAGVVLVLVFLGLAIERSIRTRRIEGWAATLDGAREARDWDQAEALLAGLPVWARADRRIERIAERVRQEREEHDRRRAEFQDLIREATAMEHDGFPDEAAAEAVLNRALERADTDASRTAVSGLRLGLQEARSARRRKALADYGKREASVLSRIQELQKEVPPADLGRFAASLKTVTMDLDAISTDHGQDPARAERIERLRRSLADLQGILADATKQDENRKQDADRIRREQAQEGTAARTARDRAMANIESAIPDLGAWERAMGEALKLSLSVGEQERFRTLQARARLFKDAAALADFDPGASLPPASVAGTESVWGKAIESLISRGGKRDAAKRALGETKGTSVFSDLAMVRGTLDIGSPQGGPGADSSDRVLYFSRRSPPKLTGSVGQRRLYEAEVFVSPWNRETRKFVSGEEVSEPRPCPHVLHLEGMLQRIEKEPDDGFHARLWDEVKRIARDREMEPIVAMQFAHRLLAPLAEDGDPELAGFATLLQTWKNIPVDIDWISGTDPNADARRKDVRKAFESLSGDELDGAIARFRFKNALEKASIGRRLRAAGTWHEEDGRPLPRFPGAPPREAWIVREDSAGRSFLVVAYRDKREWRVRPEAAPYLQEGEVLFSPAGTETTAELLRRLALEHRISREALANWVHWPSCWPSNGRTLPDG